MARNPFLPGTFLHMDYEIQNHSNEGKLPQMSNTEKKFPLTVALYKNKFAKTLVVNSFPVLDRETADKLCQAIQEAVGGYIEVREKGGLSKNGKRLPDFELQAVTTTEIARRKEFGAQKKAEQNNTIDSTDGEHRGGLVNPRSQNNFASGDDSL